ncbi:helix-turn-helix domain-containing protein [Legionella sp. D16C41]|uniref:helix-turn-helix domain-containing protein n=1 Tax=Legionella sp. D16C41 TaxID=3402688 RepID=UPI003AF9DF34
MTQLSELFTIIKKQLRLHGFTYKTLADKLHLSEASIKRIFSQEDTNISRLEEISSCLNMTLADMFELLEKSKTKISSLTIKQEEELVKDLGLLLVAICILNHWNFNDILNYYTISEHELIRYAARLDQMKIIEFLPGNRFKRLVDQNFHWIPNGPIQRFFQKTIQDDFFNCKFEEPTELYLVRSGMLSEQDNQLFQQILVKTANEFAKLCRETVDIPIDKRHGTALIIAIRPWVPEIFNNLKRPN